MDLGVGDHVLAALAAVGAGVVNALAGGGTLISFPALIGLGVPSVQSNVTNTVSLFPGYFGGTWAQRRDLVGQRQRVKSLSAAAAVGGLVGSILLVVTSEELFRGVVPYLLLLACALLAFQGPVKAQLARRATSVPRSHDRPSPGASALIFVASVYGGYFGAGLGIVFLAVLGLLVDDSLVRTNALKQALSFVTNLVAALFFLTSGKVVWSLVLVMAPASLVGGALGGRLAGRIDPRMLRGVVVTAGAAIAVKMLFF